jgi:hypothetical protein
VTCNPSKPALLNHFLNLRAEHVYLKRCLGGNPAGPSVGLDRIAAERDAKLIAFLAFDDKLSSREIPGFLLYFDSKQ